MRDCQDGKKCIPGGGIIHVVPFFNSPHSSREVLSLLRFPRVSPTHSMQHCVCSLHTQPPPSPKCGDVSHPFACLHSVKDQRDKW